MVANKVRMKGEVMSLSFWITGHVPQSRLQYLTGLHLRVANHCRRELATVWWDVLPHSMCI